VIGRVTFYLADDRVSAVLDDEGNWTSDVFEVTQTLANTCPATGDPTEGRFGVAALEKAAELLDGAVELGEVPEEEGQRLY